jgi:hypothetical protein
VKGYAQRVVGNTFAPVTSALTLRILLVLSVIMSLELRFMDVSNAFLNGSIITPIYLYPCDGYLLPGMMLRLNKMLYGLKESPLAWFLTLSARLISVGFVQCVADRCLFTLNTSAGMVWACVYVDDWCCLGTAAALKIAEAAMRSCFKLRRTDDATHFLGMRITRSASSLVLDQHQYILDLLSKFNLSNANPAPAPTLTTRLEPARELTSDERTFMADVPYAAAVGMLNWVACSTRPDICFAVKELARTVANPLPSHWKAAQRVIKYLLLSPAICIEYTNSGGMKRTHDLEVYSDADFAGETDTRKSTSGRLMFLFGNLILWKAKSQSGIALSSCESEYVAMSEAVKDVMYAKQLLACFGYSNLTAIVYGDNESAVKIARHEASMARTRNVDIKLKFLMHQAAEQSIDFTWVSTHDMLADMMTKGLGASVLNRHKSKVLSRTSN